MSVKYILDETGNPVEEPDLMKWAAWFEKAERKIARSEFFQPAWKVWLSKLLKIKRWEPARVSTVFLGLNHNYGEGEPVLFETMVFGGRYNEQMERYEYLDKAKIGHEQWVSKVKTQIPPTSKSQ